MKILVSITSGANNTERNILRSFYDGIEKFYFEKFNTNQHRKLKKNHDIDLELNYDPSIRKCDIAVQFGAVKERKNEHHLTRQSIKENAKVIIYVETPFLGRIIDRKNNYSFYRIGVDGFLNNDGVFYKEEERDKNRLEYLRTQVKIPVFTNWKDHTKGNILILLQLPGDASLRGQRMSEWLNDTVDQIRKLTDRHINIRFHPALSDKGKAEFFSECYALFFQNYPNITWNDGSESLETDLLNAGICVSYTSGSCIDAVLAGVPVIAMDEGNLTYSFSSHRIDEISNPKLASTIEIDDWLLSLANSQWNETEMREGTVWKKIEPLVLECLDQKNKDDQ